MRTPYLLLSLLVTAGCMVGESGPALDRSDQHAALVMSGEELQSELRTSPVRSAHEPFQRMGIMFDADRPTALELATSRDGIAWSAWRTVDLRNIEVDRTGSFVGELVVEDGPASFFKLRGATGSVSYARIDVLGAIVEEWEGNDADENGDAFSTAANLSLPGVTVRSRAEWSARRAGCTSTHTPKKLTIHHTDTPNADSLSVPARIRQMQNYHQNVRGWCDIGYHFLISPDGQIWEGRPIAQLGAHTGGANTNNVGIALIGSYNKTQAPAAQLDATSRLIRAIGQRYGIAISRSTVKGHREQGTTATDCPGATTFKVLASIVNAANAGPQNTPEDDAGEEPTTPPPATTIRVEGIVYEGTDPSARVAGATVTLGGKSAVTSSTGAYSIDGVAPGSYDVTISKSGYETARITRQASAGSSISVGLTRVDSGSTTPSGTAVLQGVVYRGSDGLDRIPYAVIVLSTGQTITASSSGYYIARNLPPGPITIRASAPGYASGQVTRTLVNGQTEWGSVSLD